MADILPSINCHFKDNEAAAARVREIDGIFAAAVAARVDDESSDTGARLPEEERWAHFDVADGAFTFHKSWNEPERLAEIRPTFSFEVHLMVEDPRPEMERWLSAGAKRIIVHLEAVSPEVFASLAATARLAGAGIGLALNPETPVAAATPYFGSTENFLILAVHPGLSGQKFLPAVLEKISSLRRSVPSAKIEVDGGMNIETARAAIAAGANALVSGSDIFGSPDPAREYQALRSL